MSGGASPSARRVTIVQRVLPHYRVPFFDRLHDDLAARDIELRVIYGDERPGTVPRTVKVDAPWARWIRNRYVVLGGRELVWQPALSALRHSSLIVLEQANRLLLNHVLLTGAFRGEARLAFWGHGQNFGARASIVGRLGAKLARGPLQRADWFFAYTDHSLPALAAAGFPIERTTVVRNSIDTRELAEGVAAISEAGRERLRAELGVTGDHVALYCGGMYPNKRLDFLIEAAERVRAAVPDFHLVLVGDGPDEGLVHAAAAKAPWIHPVGARYGRDRAGYFAISQALLMPGLVGLTVVDSFAACCPLITVFSPLHGPEISYLKPNVNGLITEDSVEAFSGALIGLLNDPAAHQRLAEGCRAAARDTTIEAMSQNFADGIMRCLGGASLGDMPTTTVSTERLPGLGA